MEIKSKNLINITPELYKIDHTTTTTTTTNNDYKVPFLYETWTWEGDESILPYKWLELLKFSSLSTKYENDKLKDYIREQYYKNEDFDKKSFYFITHRSDVAGCVYLKTKTKSVNSNPNENGNADKEYIIEFLLVNTKKHNNKGIEEALINIAVKKAIEIDKKINNKIEDEVINISIDLSTTNVSKSFLDKIGINF